MVYIVDFELRKPTQRYKELVEKIKQYPSYASLGEYAYLVETNASAIEIRNNLKEYIDGNDMLFVGKISAPAAWKGCSDGVTQWINSKLK